MESMADVRCIKCKHAWKAVSRIPRLCPFCGKEETIEEVCADSSFTDINDMLK
jgi:predicted amidophosphoribosyltransferase